MGKYGVQKRRAKNRELFEAIVAEMGLGLNERANIWYLRDLFVNDQTWDAIHLAKLRRDFLGLDFLARGYTAHGWKATEEDRRKGETRPADDAIIMIDYLNGSRTAEALRVARKYDKANATERAERETGLERKAQIRKILNIRSVQDPATETESERRLRINKIFYGIR